MNRLPFALRTVALLLPMLTVGACGEAVPPETRATGAATSASASPATPAPDVAATQASPPAAAPSASQTSAAASPSPAPAPAAAAKPSAGAALYKVSEGTKVDPVTMEGFRTWRAAACDRCHGPNQEGMVGPSLITSLKTLSREEFDKILLEGRLDKGMPAFKTHEGVTKNLDGLYAYLKGRSDGAITAAKVQPM